MLFYFLHFFVSLFHSSKFKNIQKVHVHQFVHRNNQDFQRFQFSTLIVHQSKSHYFCTQFWHWTRALLSLKVTVVQFLILAQNWHIGFDTCYWFCTCSSSPYKFQDLLHTEDFLPDNVFFFTCLRPTPRFCYLFKSLVHTQDQHQCSVPVSSTTQRIWHWIKSNNDDSVTRSKFCHWFKNNTLVYDTGFRPSQRVWYLYKMWTPAQNQHKVLVLALNQCQFLVSAHNLVLVQDKKQCFGTCSKPDPHQGSVTNFRPTSRYFTCSRPIPEFWHGLRHQH